MRLKSWAGDVKQSALPLLHAPRTNPSPCTRHFLLRRTKKETSFQPNLCAIYLDFKILKIDFLIKYFPVPSTVDFKFLLGHLEDSIIQIIKLLSMSLPTVLKKNSRIWMDYFLSRQNQISMEENKKVQTRL